MELASSDLAAMGAAELVRVSASIPRAAPRSFALLTACLVFPLAFAVLAHTLFTDPTAFLLRIQGVTYSDSQWLRLFAYQFLYLMVLCTFSILSTAAAVFTVASLYTNKPASISSSLTALPLILPELLDTFAWAHRLQAHQRLHPQGRVRVRTAPPSPFSYASSPLSSSSSGIHVYISALWHLASVISVLEPLCGLAALARSKRLLQGRTGTAATLVASYFTVCGVTSLLFRAAVVKGRAEEGASAWPCPGGCLWAPCAGVRSCDVLLVGFPQPED
ncbi:unnamed protein product [Miscanthus lutarioriparius]|uniref:Uncharacterized protein n=1 Tax=Miscanthus lutarioriparius TaxID=422564 RepID=A0A811SQQ4_9POAL|nr:unnamed protein product [Miscanthus lutarioriparius]